MVVYTHMIEHETDDLYDRCDAVVERVMARYDWRLLERGEFVRLVEVCVRAGVVSELWPAAMHVYCGQLYAACRGLEGAERQERGFIELHRYLFELSFREKADLAPEVREDVVNETLLRVWQHLPSYRKPGAFLAIAALELRNVMRPLWSRPTQLLPLDDLQDLAPPESGDDPLAHALKEEQRRQFRQCFDETLRRHPRARQQLEAVWLKYVAGLADDAISAYLGKSIANVYVLRTRGLNHLRTDPRWQLMKQDFGL